MCIIDFEWSFIGNVMCQQFSGQTITQFFGLWIFKCVNSKIGT